MQEHFKRRLATAKAEVEEPQGPRLKLNARPKPLLHLGTKASPVSSSPVPAVTVDDEALARQKQLVQAGVNGQQTPHLQQPAPVLPTAASIPSAPASSGDKPQAQAEKALSPSAVKVEVGNPSPGPVTARLASTLPDARQLSQPPLAMPPPARVPSASPRPPVQPSQTAAQSFTNHVPAYTPAPASFIDNYSRTKPVSEALLPSLQIATHPQLNLSKPFRLNVSPSPEFTMQSMTVMLPASQYFLQITPTVSQQLSASRQYKLFVTVNGSRVTASMKPLLNGDIGGMTIERKSVYDAPLNPGVNRIEVEVAAVTGRNGTLEVEKVSIFANLMRS